MVTRVPYLLSILYSTWVSLKVSHQEDVLAKGVLSFDLCSDGSILYSDGATVYRLEKEGRRVQLAKGEFIEQVVAGLAMQGVDVA